MSHHVDLSLAETLKVGSWLLFCTVQMNRWEVVWSPASFQADPVIKQKRFCLTLGHKVLAKMLSSPEFCVRTAMRQQWQPQSMLKLCSATHRYWWANLVPHIPGIWNRLHHPLHVIDSKSDRDVQGGFFWVWNWQFGSGGSRLTLYNIRGWIEKYLTENSVWPFGTHFFAEYWESGLIDSSSWLEHCVVFFGKTLILSQCLSPPRSIKLMGTRNCQGNLTKILGGTCDGLIASHKGE